MEANSDGKIPESPVEEVEIRPGREHFLKIKVGFSGRNTRKETVPAKQEPRAKSGRLSTDAQKSVRLLIPVCRTEPHGSSIFLEGESIALLLLMMIIIIFQCNCI